MNEVNKKVQQMKLIMQKRLEKEATRALKKDLKVKDIVKDMRQHFKTDKYGLSYVIYKDLCGIRSTMLFNTILARLRYIIKQDTYTKDFIILPKRRS